MPRVLVADDSSNIQRMVTRALQDQGIEVVAVGNGEAAVRKLPDLRPDLVLADIFMPVRNGFEVCEFIKQDARFAQTPVILLVGAFDPLDEREVQRVGADGVLKKPFVPPDPLISMVKSVLAKCGIEIPVAVAVPVAVTVPAEAELLVPAPVGVAVEPPREHVEAAEEPEPFEVPRLPVAFTDAEKPLAFSELLHAPAGESAEVAKADTEPAPEESPRFGEMRFWHSPDTAEEPQEEEESSELGPEEPARPRQDEAAFLRAMDSAEPEPASAAVEEPAPAPEPEPSKPAAQSKWSIGKWFTPASVSQVEPPAVKIIKEPSATPPPPASQHKPKPEMPSVATPKRPAYEMPSSPIVESHEEVFAAPAAEPEPIAPALMASFTGRAMRSTFPPAKPAEAPAPEPLPAPVKTPAPASAAYSIEVPPPPDKELVERVVARVLEDMQPQILDIITREVLKPIVEALVRREIEKH